MNLAKYPKPKLERIAVNEEVIQAARWFVSLTGNTEETSEYQRLQKAVVEYNKYSPLESLQKETPVSTLKLRR